MTDVVTAVLASVPTEWEANLIAQALREKGVAAESSGALTAGFRAEAPGMVRVIVPETDLALAKAALAEFRREAKDVDWSKIDVGEREDA